MAARYEASANPTERSTIEALSEATGAVAGVFELDAVLQLIVDRVRALVGAQYAALGILGDHHRIERFVTSGITAEQRALIGPPPQGHGLLGLIITEGTSLRVSDIAAHPQRHGFPPHHPPMTTLLGVPVRLKNRAVGNLYLADKLGADEFTDDDQRLVELFALHAGIAIENARLHEAVQHLAVVDERERIGRDLHDGIIQSLYAIALSLEDVPDLMSDDRPEAAGRIDRAIDSLNATIRDLRQFLVGLRPAVVDRTSLAALLVALIQQFRERDIGEIELSLPDVPIDVPPHVRAELLHIAREGLSNVARHAGASSARVSLATEGAELRLGIADDGRGFDTQAILHEGHHGLRNMRERAVALGGTLALTSSPTGTTIIVRMPIGPSGISPSSENEEDARP